MLFKKLVFDNYKTYYGHQEVNFYIPKKVREEEGKNIILLGGLNGAGKTTILKAILYVLFGKRGITEEEHKRLFSNVINNTFFDEGGRDCSVSLTIETDKGEDWELKVKWSFDHNKRLISENRNISIRKIGLRHQRHVQIDNIEAFNRFIDKMIPYHAAPFFIFDGEEIKDIILRQNSSEMKEAIQKITGMEAYKQLLNDLTSVKSNLQNKLAKAVSQSKKSNLQTQLNDIELEISKQDNRRITLFTEKKELEDKITVAKQARNEKVANNSKSREVIVKKQTQRNTELKHTIAEFEKTFKENAIYIILSKKIPKLKKQLKLENEIRNKKLIQDASLIPYRDFMNQLLSQTITPPLTEVQLNQIQTIGEEIWMKENDIKEVDDDFDEIHDISTKDYSYLTNLPIKDKNLIVTLINKIEKLNHELENIEHEIRNAPEVVDISSENEKIDLLTKKYGEVDLKYKVLMKKINTLKDSRSSLLNQITRLSDQNENSEELNKQLESVNSLIKGMNEYVKEMITMKAHFIKDEFATMLKKLFRKQDEFGKIEFDINTYTIRLFNDRNQEISIQDRSAGEMQMISSALIWALTKVSDLGLPMVIDTPLGRLDSFHRNHLINHYYKELSEQVIILSTDTEITQEYVTLMQNSSYRQYMLDYDQKRKYTIIRDGYFDFVRV
ncbi:DNA sulfur modification protein DndD [Anaerobacillus sp. MEB173]|uniref:DNA sulfur modification protein DndD n=1 Tax=Anaerobacillus sp. MEB173 TaxID=3383345 RepID=UPI003F8EA192